MTGRDRTVLMVVIVLAIIGAGWLLVVSPERKEATAVEATVTTAQSQLSTAEGQLREAQTAQKKYASAYASVVSLGKAVPAGQEVPSLIYQVAKASDHKKVEFNSIATVQASGAAATPAATGAAATAAFTAMPFTFAFGGGFFDLEHLFRQLTSFTTHKGANGLRVSGRLLTIQSVKLTPDPVNKGKLTSTITATAYVLPASQSVTGAATPTSPTGAATPATTTATTSAPAPAVIKVTP